MNTNHQHLSSDIYERANQLLSPYFDLDSLPERGPQSTVPAIGPGIYKTIVNEQVLKISLVMRKHCDCPCLLEIPYTLATPSCSENVTRNLADEKTQIEFQRFLSGRRESTGDDEVYLLTHVSGC